MSDKPGVVINVVTKAIITNITNIGGGSMPISYPMFSTISSIKPRVFISTPIERLSRHDSPRILAVNAPPRNLPAMATKIIITQIVQR